MFKKIATAAVLAAALAFSAGAPAVLAAGSPEDHAGKVVAKSGNWPYPASAKDKKDKSADDSVTPYSGDWPYPA
ncbi:hypothetical protein ACLH0K_14885 [Arthrobacter sp. MPF02]|uniref:hypothetical protein n=1 Tax=Arthrobacter sp. MPF02 TaxID=3388492 RepID=UPI00398483F4